MVLLSGMGLGLDVSWQFKISITFLFCQEVRIVIQYDQSTCHPSMPGGSGPGKDTATVRQQVYHSAGLLMTSKGF